MRGYRNGILKRPLGENKIGEEYPLAGHNVSNLSVRKASIRGLLHANIPYTFVATQHERS